MVSRFCCGARYRNGRRPFLIYEEKRRFIGIFVKPGQNSAPRETPRPPGRPRGGASINAVCPMSLTASPEAGTLHETVTPWHDRTHAFSAPIRRPFSNAQTVRSFGS